MRLLPHIKRLDDCFGDFLVRVVCACGACREIQPQALARLVGWKMTLRERALRMGHGVCVSVSPKALREDGSRRVDPFLEPEPRRDPRPTDQGSAQSVVPPPMSVPHAMSVFET